MPVGKPGTSTRDDLSAKNQKGPVC
jgi:hypothetical protein